MDEARFYVEQDLVNSRRIEKIGFVGEVGAASADSPRTNAEGDVCFTDGLRAVFFVGRRLVSLDELQVLNWSLPPEMELFRETIFGFGNRRRVTPNVAMVNHGKCALASVFAELAANDCLGR